MTLRHDGLFDRFKSLGIYNQRSSALFFLQAPRQKSTHLLNLVFWDCYPLQLSYRWLFELIIVTNRYFTDNHPVGSFTFIMSFSFFAVLSVLLAYYTVSSAAASADCLRQTGFPANSSSIPARISVGVACSETENRTCSVQSGGYVEASSTLNITTSHTADILDTFGKAHNVPFNQVKYVDGSNSEFNVEPGQNGYIGYTFSQRCYTGVIEGDCFDDVSTGTPVTACRPRIEQNISNEPTLQGDITFVDTDEATARNMTDNPALAVKPKASGAVDLLGQGGWRSSLLMVTIVMGVVMIENFGVAL